MLRVRGKGESSEGKINLNYVRPLTCCERKNKMDSYIGTQSWAMDTHRDLADLIQTVRTLEKRIEQLELERRLTPHQPDAEYAPSWDGEPHPIPF
jgi:hypothetical protein